MHTQYCAQNKRLSFYFSEHKLRVEIDEYSHADRDIACKQSRKLIIKKYNIRINPDSADFNIYRLINQICMHIKQPTKEPLIHNLSK